METWNLNDTYIYIQYTFFFDSLIILGAGFKDFEWICFKVFFIFVPDPKRQMIRFNLTKAYLTIW